MSQKIQKKYTHIYIQILSSGSPISEGRLKLPVTIGRHPANKICFNNAMAISRYHLKIDEGPDQQIYITNLSKNGYLLNNVPYYNTQKINENDVIRFSGFSKSVVIKTIFRSSQSKAEDESKPSIHVYHSQSKIMQLSQILQQKMQNQFRSIHAIYLIAIFIILLVFIILGYNFIKSNKSLIEHFSQRNDSKIIIVKEKNPGTNIQKTDSAQPRTIEQDTHSSSSQPNIPARTIPDISLLNKNFGNVLVELVLRVGTETIVQNGFFHNGICYTPLDKSLPINNIRSAFAYFVSRTAPVELSLKSLEAPFLRFYVKNNDFIPLVKPVETDLTLVKPGETILLLQYRRKNNRFLISRYQAVAIDVKPEKIVCKCPNMSIKPGCLAVSVNQNILGLVTDIDNMNTYLIESLASIEDKIHSIN